MRPFTLAPALALALVVTMPRKAAADEPWPRPPRAPIVLPDEGPPPWGAQGVVYLHVLSSAPRLQLRVFDGIVHSDGGRRRGRMVSRFVCTAPCDRILDAREGARYFFDGPGITPSSFFRLNDRAGPVAIAVQAGDRRALNAGTIATAFAALFSLAGASAVGVGAAEPRSLAGDGRGLQLAGGSMLAGAAVAVVAGAVLIARGATSFRFSRPVPP